MIVRIIWGRSDAVPFEEDDEKKERKIYRNEIISSLKDSNIFIIYIRSLSAHCFTYIAKQRLFYIIQIHKNENV